MTRRRKGTKKARIFFSPDHDRPTEAELGVRRWSKAQIQRQWPGGVYDTAPVAKSMQQRFGKGTDQGRPLG